MQAQPTSTSPEASRRFMSVDALRGFDMLWIVGAASLVGAADKLGGTQGTGLLHVIRQQLSHKEWEGFAFYDLIFPLFVFLVGVSIVFSLSRALSSASGKRDAYLRVLRRFVLLYVVALFYSGGMSKEWPELRLMGVLNRIALCYLFASLAFLNLRARGLAMLCAGLLLGYWGLMALTPIPDLRPRNPQGELISEALTVEKVSELNWNSTNTLRGSYQPGLNLANYIDQKYLPGRKHDGTYDPEGLLSTIPAIGTCLLGVFAGLLLRSTRIPDQKKVSYLLIAGATSVAVGFLWGTQFPVIKKIWTSSYVLVAGGYSAMLLGAFHQIIEVWGFQKWAQPFVWVGANALTIYLANNIIGFRDVASRFAGGSIQKFLNTSVTPGAGDLLLAAVAVCVGLALVRFLYKKKIFLRL